MRFIWLLLAAFAFPIALSACSTGPQASAWPVLTDCPRPSPQLLQPVPPLQPIPTRPRPREIQSASPPTPTSEPGPSEPEPPTRYAARGLTP